MNNTAIMTINNTTDNTTTTGAVKHKKSVNYLKHILIGAMLAVFTFTATLAAQPKIATEPDYPGVEYIVANADENDVVALSNYMDSDIVEAMKTEMEIEDNEVPLSAGEFIVSYVTRDESIIEHIENHFLGEK